MDADFLLLTPVLMEFVEDVIFGEEERELRYYCFHFYSDSYLSHIFQRLSCRIEKLLKERMPKDFRTSQSNLLALIYLKEPIVWAKDEKYKAENYLCLRSVVFADPKVFRKYLTIL